MCSRQCEFKFYLKVLPFSSVQNYQLADELSIGASSEEVDTLQSTSSLNVPTSQIVAPNNPSNEKTGDSLNDCVDSFSHVYCEYICQNEVPNLMCTGNPNSVSIFHANVDGLNSKLDDIN